MSKQGMTLEQQAHKWMEAKVGFDLSSENEVFRSMAVFARKLLEEARPYMQHTSGCWSRQPSSNASTTFNDRPCDCGLAELLEGWK